MKPRGVDPCGLLATWGFTGEETDRAALPSLPWLGMGGTHICQAWKSLPNAQPCQIFPEMPTPKHFTAVKGLGFAACPVLVWLLDVVLAQVRGCCTGC